MSWGFDLMDIIERKWIWKLTTIFALGKAAYYTSDAQATQHRAFQLGAKNNRASLIPWGVDCEHFSPQPRETAVGQSQLFTLFCNRSWEPTYGVDVLAKAFCKVASTRGDVRLLLLGSGSMEEKIIGILSNGKVLDKVLLPGRISQEVLPNYYRKADLYISPSHVDGSSVSLMEALACGLPVLVSDILGNLPWVQEKKNGWSFRDNDVDMLANKIINAIEERESLHEMGEKARQLALEKANWKINFQALLQTYQDTLSAEKRDK
jgi:glycosyltransferase involved in cell wall biosynthesis